MTLVTIYERYLDDNDIERDATESLLKFLDWNEVDEEQFGQEVKMVLASAEFSKELTISVMWLNDYGLDISCVRMNPYTNDGQIFVDVQTVIPIPEVADYQVRIREKKQKARDFRKSSRDLTKYDVSIAGEQYRAQNKRRMMFHLISGVMSNGATPQQVMDAVPWKRSRLFEVFEGNLTTEQVYEQIMKDDVGGRHPRASRFFVNDGETFHFDGKTYVLSNQWGNRTLEAAESLAEMFSNLEIEIKRSDMAVQD